MDSIRTFLFLLVLLRLVLFLDAFTIENDFGHCESTVKKWASSSHNLEIKEDRHTLQDLLFFLHVPRTGGRTYFHCFLQKLYPRSMACPRSYDKLRFDPSKSNCRLLVTHDDYSVSLKLPKQKTSVVTILRNPLDRVFSTYEFSVEVASRFLVHPSLKSSIQMSEKLRSKSKGVSTLDIWPWKYLVPWMMEDLFGRRDARKHRSQNSVSSNDSYNMDIFVMPLHEYINNPIAKDIIHNGATLQVAGLTNNSYSAESHEVRRCVQNHPALGHYVLEVAKRRLDEMLYVGLTEDHRESATMFANVVGAQVISQVSTLVSNMENAAINLSAQNSSFADSEPEIGHSINNTIYPNHSQMAPMDNAEEATGNVTVKKLMEDYGDCTRHLRRLESRRRTASLKMISPVNFSKEARLRVSEGVVEQIMKLNDLDVELYGHARGIFARQHEHMFEKLVGWEGQERWVGNVWEGVQCWRVGALAVMIVFSLVAVAVVKARRRTSKIKV